MFEKDLYRKMRLLIMFDLPSVESSDISNNNKFVKNLKLVAEDKKVAQ